MFGIKINSDKLSKITFGGSNNKAEEGEHNWPIYVGSPYKKLVLLYSFISIHEFYFA